MSLPTYNEEELDSIASNIVLLFYPIGYIFDKFAEFQHRLLGSPTEETAIREAIKKGD
jgi:hypothetical protein